MKNNIWLEKVEARTYETDFQLRWKPAAFFRAMEEAAVHHATQLGYDYFTLQKNNLAWILSRTKIKFYHFPQPGEKVHLLTWPKGIHQKIFFMRDFLITDAQENLFAKASTAWLLIDTNKRRFVRPDLLPGEMPDNDGKYALNEELEKIAHQNNLQEMGRFQAKYSAVDMMGHVNNTQYIDWIFDCFSFEQIRGSQLDWIQINYSSEVKPEEEVKLSIGRNQDNTFSVEGYNQNSETIAFEAQFGIKDSTAST
jgi:acyl-ACP thioesterase